VIAADGSVAGSNASDEDAARLAAGALRLVETADEVRSAHDLGPLSQLEAATTDGSVFVVRDGDRMIVATTTPEPTVGLVFYDLKTCVRAVDAAKPKSRPRTPRKKLDDAAS